MDKVILKDLSIFARFPVAETARVEIRKPSAPIEAIFAYTPVVVERSRDG